MITEKKFLSLKSRVQLRKLADIFHERRRLNYSDEYLSSILRAAESNELMTKEVFDRIEYLTSSSEMGDEDVYYYLLSLLGEDAADWDLVGEDGSVSWEERRVLEHYLYLDHIRSPYNLGSIFRSAESFGIKELLLSPGCPDPHNKRAERVSRGTVNGVGHRELTLNELASLGLPIFALELGGEELSSFSFPRSGICILGSEETGVSAEALSIADRSLGRVSIAQLGAKGSINVASAAAICMYKWMEAEQK